MQIPSLPIGADMGDFFLSVLSQEPSCRSFMQTTKLCRKLLKKPFVFQYYSMVRFTKRKKYDKI